MILVLAEAVKNTKNAAEKINNMNVTLPLILSTAFLDSFNPCAISLLLIYIGLMFTMQKSRKAIMSFGFFYISAIYVTYFMIGLGLLRVFQFFQIPNFILFVAASISILFGILNIIEYFFPNTPLSIRMPLSVRQKAGEWAYKASIPAAIVLGFLVGITEFPCSGAVYLAVLGYLQAKESFSSGVAYLLIYNLVFVLPLVLIYIAASSRLTTEKMINWQERSGRKMHLLLAAVMILLGFFMLKPHFLLGVILTPVFWIITLVVLALVVEKSNR